MIPAIAAALIPLVPRLISFAEGAFKRSKAGVDRKDAIAQALRAIIAKGQATGDIPEEAVTDDSIHALIETVFQQMRAEAKPVVKTRRITITIEE